MADKIEVTYSILSLDLAFANSHCLSPCRWCGAAAHARATTYRCTARMARACKWGRREGEGGKTLVHLYQGDTSIGETLGQGERSTERHPNKKDVAGAAGLGQVLLLVQLPVHHNIDT